MALQKQSRPSNHEVYSGQEYDFGDPNLIEIVVSNNISLTLREPDVEDLLALNEIEKNAQGNQILQTLETICLLHTPDSSRNKITMKDAKKLRVQDLKKIGEAINKLVSFEDSNLDNKSDVEI